MYGRYFLMLLCLGMVWVWQHKVDVKRWWCSHAGGDAGRVQVYTRAGCDRCERAATLIEGAGVPVTRRHIDRDEAARADIEDYGDVLPLIIDGNRYLKGYDEKFLTEWYVERPRNRELLARAGVYREGEERLPVVFGTAWCGACVNARRYFRDHGIAFRDLDIEHDSEAQRQYDMIGLSGVPVVVYEDMIWRGFGAKSMDSRREWVGAR